MRTCPGEAPSPFDGNRRSIDGVDGEHRGLIRKMVDQVAELVVHSVTYTFEPPPRAYYQNAQVL